jgi:hypothetical protein
LESFYLALARIDQKRNDIFLSTKSDIELLDSPRLGTDEYDFESAKFIKEGELSSLYEIKSKIDGKTYTAKIIHYKFGS